MLLRVDPQDTEKIRQLRSRADNGDSVPAGIGDGVGRRSTVADELGRAGLDLESLVACDHAICSTHTQPLPPRPEVAGPVVVEAQPPPPPPMIDPPATHTPAADDPPAPPMNV